MARLNWHDRILAYMVEHGYQEIGIRSESKKRRFSLTLPGEKYRQYVLTRGGAVRRELLNENGSVIHSTSVTELYQRFVGEWEHKQSQQKDA